MTLTGVILRFKKKQKKRDFSPSNLIMNTHAHSNILTQYRKLSIERITIYEFCKYEYDYK